MTSNADVAGLHVSGRKAAAITATNVRLNEAWRLAGVCVLWITSLLVVAIWVAGGGVQTVAAGVSGTWPEMTVSPDAVTSFGRLAGLVASNLLLYQVLLMARIPLFERAFGHDALTRAHRLTGFWSFWLMVAHIVLIVIGYASTTSHGLIAELWQMIVSFQDMVPAAIGTLALVAVVVSSIRRARRRTRYEMWHFLHLYAYVGIFLALPHQLSTGADFISSPLASAYWWVLWGTAALATLAFRIIAPLRLSARHQLTVSSVTPDGTRGVTVVMTGRHLDTLGAEAGQFFIWHFLDGRGLPVGHPFSISSRPDGSHLSITARVVGDGTRRIAAMGRGTHVLIEGPYGHMTARVRRGRRLLMIGAGAGVAPLVSLLEDMPFRRGEATLITRESRSGEALLNGPISSLVAHRGLRHIALVGSRGTQGSPWLSDACGTNNGPEVLRSSVPDLRDLDVYLCGPGQWMSSVRADLRRVGVPDTFVHFENFSI